MEKLKNDSKQNKISLLKQMIENAERNIAAAKQILYQFNGAGKKAEKTSDTSQVIEGTFDGEKMISFSGKNYSVPANYASKSKLVEGDLLKLTITEDGAFLYKQISPVERRRIIGTVMIDSNNKYYVLSEGKKYNVLMASITYFKALEGDEVIIVIPKEKPSKWASIETVVKNSSTYSVEDLQNKKTEDKKRLENQSENYKKDNNKIIKDESGEIDYDFKKIGKNEIAGDKNDDNEIKDNNADNNPEDGGRSDEYKKLGFDQDIKKDEEMENEWTPSIDEMKKEISSDKYKDSDLISDDLIK